MTATMSDQAVAAKPRDREARKPDFIVRAKTGPGFKEWASIGLAWKRQRGEGYSIKLNTMPIGNHWNGVLKLLPPFADDSDVPDAEHD